MAVNRMVPVVPIIVSHRVVDGKVLGVLRGSYEIVELARIAPEEVAMANNPLTGIPLISDSDLVKAVDSVRAIPEPAKGKGWPKGKPRGKKAAAAATEEAPVAVQAKEQVVNGASVEA